MDQPPAVAFTAFADRWPRATKAEIGAALCAIGTGRTLPLILTTAQTLNKNNEIEVCNSVSENILKVNPYLASPSRLSRTITSITIEIAYHFCNNFFQHSRLYSTLYSMFF